MYERLFSKRGLSLDRLRVLLEVKDAGGIVRAARADPVRQSQYSRQLRELEDYFGVALTERKGRNLTLTKAGEELARVVKEQFDSLEYFSRRALEESIPVNVGGGESMIHWLFIPLMGQIRKAHPRLVLRFYNLTTTQSLQRLNARELELGLVSRAPSDGSIASQKMGRMGFSLYVPSVLLEGVTIHRDQRLMAHLPMAVMPASSSFGRSVFENARESSVCINTVFECDTFTGLGRAVQTGSFAAILPDLAADYVGRDVERIPLDFLKALARDYYLAWPKRVAERSPEVNRLKNWLLKEIKMPAGKAKVKT